MRHVLSALTRRTATSPVGLVEVRGIGKAD